MSHYREFSDINASEGFHTLFTYANEVTDGLFINGVLVALFIVIMMGSFFSQKRLTGNGDLAVSFAIAGYVVAGLTFILSIIPNMINIFSVVICVTLAIIGTAWMYLSKSSD